MSISTALFGLKSALSRLKKKTNITKLNSYIFRKTYGCIMAEAGVDRGQLAKLIYLKNWSG